MSYCRNEGGRWDSLLGNHACETAGGKFGVRIDVARIAVSFQVGERPLRGLVRPELYLVRSRIWVGGNLEVDIL